MNYTHLGRTGLKVSRLCLGTMNFGDVTDEKTSARILDEALEAGINFIDTADVYGTEQSPDIQQGSGLSEEIIGRWLQQGGRRERIVLATKVYQPMGPGPNDRRLSAYHIRKACEDSLRRLKTDHIDVYQMHHIDRHTPWEEIWQAMELLVQQGKVLYIGSSNFAGWDIATAQSVATARHFLGLVAEQSLYNLTARTIELEVIPACRHFIDNYIVIITNSQPAKTDDFFRISKRRNCPVSKTMSLPMVEPAIHNHFCMINVRIWSRRIKSVRSGITINFE